MNSVTGNSVAMIWSGESHDLICTAPNCLAGLTRLFNEVTDFERDALTAALKRDNESSLSCIDELDNALELELSPIELRLFLSPMVNLSVGVEWREDSLRWLSDDREL